MIHCCVVSWIYERLRTIRCENMPTLCAKCSFNKTTCLEHDRWNVLAGLKAFALKHNMETNTSTNSSHVREVCALLFIWQLAMRLRLSKTKTFYRDQTVWCLRLGLISPFLCLLVWRNVPCTQYQSIVPLRRLWESLGSDAKCIPHELPVA